MKKHLLVCLLALALASLCMLPSRVQAAEETHDHCFCGADHVNTGSHSDSPGTWTAWKVNQNGEVKWPKVGGRYYLTDDVVLTETWVVPETNTPIVLCLNGRSITMEGRGPAIEVNGTSTHTINLTITNCKGEGKITHCGGAKGPAVKVGEYGSFTMYGGTITGNQVEDNGGGVYVDGALKYSAAPATCTAAAKYYKSCACGASSEGTAGQATFTVGNPLGHKYELKALDGTYHAMHCTNGCDTWDTDTKAAHSYDGLEGTKCKDCGYVRFVGHYTVSIAVEGNGFGTVSANAVKNVPEGATITVNGGELTIRGTKDTKVTATASANTPQYTYTFTGWTIGGQPIPENYPINKPVTIKASFNRVVNQYTVTWDAADGTIQDTVYTSGKQDWGTQITAPANVVKAPDSSFSYAFTGWKDADGNDPAATVTGNVTYTAQYTKVAHVYEAGDWKYDDSCHWHVCTVSDCGYATEKTSHIYADADATVCTDCGASRTLPKLTGKVEIIGELAKGERLTVVATDLPSTVTQLRYQWLRNDTIITGANGMDYTLTAEDVGAKISVNVTAVGHTGSLYAIAAGQVDVIYTVSYDTNGGTIGTLRQDRVKFGTDYTLPECDFITAPDKKTFDLWEIDGVSYKAGTTYRVMNDVTVVALWKDAGSDRPAPTPSRPSHKGSTIEAISTVDGRSATDYSGGIYGLTFRSTAGFSSFLGVQVDGGTIAPSCYSAEEGSIVVYLKAVYLRTLKAGTHTITILSSEGNASMEFTVGGVTTSPKTFDAGVAGYVSIALLGLTGGSLCLRRKKDGNA